LIFCKIHDVSEEGGHTGITKTIDKVARHYLCKNMSRKIKEHIRKFPKCQKSKVTTHTKTTLTITETPICAFDTDMGPLPNQTAETNWLFQ